MAGTTIFTKKHNKFMDRETYFRLQNALKKYMVYNELVAASAAAGLPLAPPIRASLRVTSRCNSDCAYCPYGKSRSKNRLDLPLDTLRQAIGSLADLGVKLLFLSGGEPLLRSDIFDICVHATQLGMTVQLATNGLLLTKDIAKNLNDAGVANLIMSLDSLQEDIYYIHRGITRPRITDALETLSFFSGLNDNNSAAVTFVVSQKNILELPSFISFVETFGKGRIGVNIQPYHKSAISRDSTLEPDAEDETAWISTIEQVIELKRAASHINVSEDYLRDIPAFVFHKDTMKGYCLSGYYGMYVQENMDVLPCWRLPPVGNLKDNTALDVWLSKPYKDARQRMLHKDCNKCMLMCHTSLGNWANYLFDPDTYPKKHKNE